MAVAATAVLIGISNLGPARDTTPADGIRVGLPAPEFMGTTLDGEHLDLASYRGRPVIVNFWGPSCIPCRDEFALFIDRTAAHAADGLALIGVLMFDPPSTARDFVRDQGATWPTVLDPDETIKTAYRAVARPQTYFVDRGGVLRHIQVGELTAVEFDRFYADIADPPLTAP
ncbi:MAG: TlpA disulfide reductase family protein [Chloroflexota bacterium]